MCRAVLFDRYEAVAGVAVACTLLSLMLAMCHVVACISPPLKVEKKLFPTINCVGTKSQSIGCSASTTMYQMEALGIEE